MALARGWGVSTGDALSFDVHDGYLHEPDRAPLRIRGQGCGVDAGGDAHNCSGQAVFTESVAICVMGR